MRVKEIYHEFQNSAAVFLVVSQDSRYQTRKRIKSHRFLIKQFISLGAKIKINYHEHNSPESKIHTRLYGFNWFLIESRIYW